ncbi:MAG: DegT/DnrJ/EryC1/StrS family aminotransferase [Candidatus Acidiferrales bacterium]
MSIPLSLPHISEREVELVNHVLRSGRLSIGPFVEEFEKRFADYVGRKFAIAVNSGTSALHLCVRALGIGAKDEVLTTPFTFVASANCLLYEGATPSFVDVDPGTLNIDPVAIRHAIERDYMVDKVRRRLVNRLNGRTLKGILPVHVFGLPCDMPAILEIANEWGLYVIEDACEALGAEIRGTRAGAFSHAAAFGFYPNKQMTTGEGGMIVTDDPAIAEYCRAARNQGRDASEAWLRHSLVGFNYRLSELHCALGVAQLERIDDLLAARVSVAEYYAESLAGIPQIGLPWDPTDTIRSWFAYVIQMKGPAGPTLRDRLIAGLKKRDIGCQTYFPCVHLQPYFEKLRLLPKRSLSVAESASERCLALPFFPSMTEEQVEEVCTAVREVISGTSAIARQRQLVGACGAA